MWFDVKPDNKTSTILFMSKVLNFRVKLINKVRKRRIEFI